MQKKAKVLVADDEPVICRTCQRILTDEGYAVETVGSGREALKHLECDQYDVLLMDLKMPEVSGMDVLREVRARALDTAVIVMTGYATVQTAVESMKLGAFDYVPKPFTPDELTIVVRNALERKELTDENRRLRSFVAEWSDRARAMLEERDLTPEERDILSSGDPIAVARLWMDHLLPSERIGEPDVT